MHKYIDVIVPLPIANQFTYSLPEEMEEMIQVGCRVIVPFGTRKYYTAIVVGIHDDAPVGFRVKEVLQVLDHQPVILPRQYKLWQWVADYYLCTLGDVYKAAIPSGLKIESETLVVYNDDFEAEEPLVQREQMVMDILSTDKEQRIDQIEKRLGQKNLLPVIKTLLEKGAILIKEKLKNTYKPKTERYIRLPVYIDNELAVHSLMDSLKRAPRQLAVLARYIELSGWNTDGRDIAEVSCHTLAAAAGASMSILKQLADRNAMEIYTKEIGRLNSYDEATQQVNLLNPSQTIAYRQIMSSFMTHNVCLLHGVTASGKTEIYIHLIRQVIQSGKQVLYLLPEIALTTQITDRLSRVFGNKLGVYHSKFPDAERVEIWRKQLGDNDYDVILGVRSSVFLPFRRLGLVIVDEEHENSYKQQDPAPRYHARNAAIMLASMFGAKTLLGTATPCMETYYNATHSKYGLVELKERHKNIQLPRIEVVDIKELARKKMMNMQFSPLLLRHIREALDHKEQVILFQNRRGFAPMLECKACGWVPKCNNCDVSLTYHKGLNQLTCHYCGYTYHVPRSCPACGGTDMVSRGFGTEKIEDEIKQLFPEARVARMDLDTTRTRTAYERIIKDFQEYRTDILIGTQMVSKGLDFDKVSMVGILNADSMLTYPDFRSYERAFQLMAQVSGRAGRKDKQGLVILQTKSPDLPLIHEVVNNDFAGLYAEQLEERELFRYPPFYRLIYVFLKHSKEGVVTEAADTMAAYLRQGLGDRVLGPDKPPVARVQTLFIKKIVIKIEQKASTAKIKDYLQQVQRAVLEDDRFRSLLVYYDVDPM